MGNSLLFILYMYAFLIQPHLKKPIDMIFTHLTLVNVLSIVFRLIPDVMASFAVKLLFHDVGCKAVLYAYSVTRGLSICTILLLSVFQAITVSPNHSKWACILLLVGFFVFFYFSNTFVTFYSLHRPKKSSVLDLISGALSSGYPIVCPYVLMNNRKIISKFISSLSNFECSFSTRGCHG
uniref:vomeronasal type-1 receptor 1-like n=1 Tax=Myodes glareolus TaxID=447135 RepID=UPI0020208189|nr:vomeronasal type-1 receptor 1-like [Myodes glareolus]